MLDRAPASDDRAQLREIAQAILAAGNAPAAVVAPAEALRQLVERCSGFDYAAPAHGAQHQRKLPQGVALAPVQAARCASQPWRTAAFVQGAAAALMAARQRCGDRPVRVLYAGCGPFALLALPLMALWPADQAQFTLLDIHRDTLASARRLVSGLGLDAGVAAWIEADATALRLDPDALPDIILSETMSAALAHEPQVAIARNLLGQASPALLVPACVRVDLALCDPARENGYQATPRRERIALGEVFRLDAPAIAGWAEAGACLPAAAIALPDSIPPRYQARLLTRIDVFAGITLDDYASSLNLPRPLPGSPALQPGDVLRFHYRLGGDPGLACDILSTHLISEHHT